MPNDEEREEQDRRRAEIKALLERVGLSINALAARAGYAHQSVYDALGGQRNLTLTMYMRLLAAITEFPTNTTTEESDHGTDR